VCSRSLGMGSFFGESILDDSPRENTVVTREPCLLLRIQQQDFKALFQVLISLFLSFIQYSYQLVVS